MTEKRIIWADDEIAQLQPHIIFLQERGYSVEGVHSGEDAVALVQSGGFDLVLLDEMMPGMDGLTTLEEIRKIDKRIPVVMITKSMEETLMEDAIGKEIADYLVKPVNPHQILSTLKRIFDSGRIVGQQLTRDYTTEYRDMVMRPSQKASPEQWLELSFWLAEWDVILDSHSELGLTRTHRDFRRECNGEFSRYIESNWEQWIWSERENRPMLSVDVAGEHVIPALGAGEKVFFVVIDCMRLDQWLTVESLLSDYYNIETDVFFSLLPSATPYARNAVFSGLFPYEISQRYPDLWINPLDDSSSRNRYEHQLLDKLIAQNGIDLPGDTKYIKILDPEEGESLVHRLKSYLSAPMTSVVANFLDILAHSRAANEVLREMSPDEGAYRSVMKTWFAHSSLLKALRAIARENVTVVITTDHGSTIGRRGTKAFGKRDTSPNLRYKFGDNINCDEKGGIFIRNPKDWRLPSFTRTTNFIIAKEDYYFVYPTNFSQFERQYRNSFLHGGISIEEMVVPVAVLRPK
ncbi:MAG TPA: response regulator [candidate division Zixibacteria bacterium]|nr:response regulator [candidate division Zixibacteria bacterium]